MYHICTIEEIFALSHKFAFLREFFLILLLEFRFYF